jgi:hypothetical protein
MSVPGIEAVSWRPSTNKVVWAVPFHTTTELALKLPPFTVKVKPAPPAVALAGEIELIDGVDGQEQETAGSKKTANAPRRDDLFIVAIGVHFRQASGRAERQGTRLKRMICHPRIYQGAVTLRVALTTAVPVYPP